jgi:hypothetical protein
MSNSALTLPQLESNNLEVRPLIGDGGGGGVARRGENLPRRLGGCDSNLLQRCRTKGA